MVIKIFKSKEEGLIEIKEIGGKEFFDYEKEIQSLVEKNIETIFPELEFVYSEFPLPGFRIDSVAFNNEINSFVIIEYKKLKHGGVIDQGMAYLDLLETRKEAFLLLYNKEKQKQLDFNDVKWEESKVVVIAPEFTPHQLLAANRTNEPIELWKIRKFEDGTFTLQRIHDKEKNQIKKVRKHDTVTLGEYAEENYLAGKYEAPLVSEETRELFFKFKEAILSKFPDLETKQRKQYVGFYSTENDSSICTIEAQQKKLKLDYCTTSTDILPDIPFIRYMKHPDGKRIGHYGIGDYESEINNTSDIEKALPLIEKIYHLKTK